MISENPLKERGDTGGTVSFVAALRRTADVGLLAELSLGIAVESKPHQITQSTPE